MNRGNPLFFMFRVSISQQKAVNFKHLKLFQIKNTHSLSLNNRRKNPFFSFEFEEEPSSSFAL